MLLYTLSTTWYPSAAWLLLFALIAYAGRYTRATVLVDFALVALAFYAKWGVPVALVLFLARRWPAWCADVVHALGLPSNAVTRFVLPGLQAPPTRAAAQLPPVVVAIGKTTRLDTPQSHARPIEPAEWMRGCNDDPTAPHLGVIGPTQQGKTTFVQALIARRPGELVITTTKSDLWAGAEVIRPSMRIESGKGVVDWTPITDAINRVHVEMLRRNIEHDTHAPQLNLIVDEFTTTLGNVPSETKKQILEIWSMGASCGVRTIVIAQEVNARAWGLEGRRDLLGNLLFARVAPGRLWSLGRLDPNGGLLDPQPLDTGALVALAAEAQLVGREWAGLGGGGAPTGCVPGAGGALQGANTHAHTNTRANDADARIALYARWRAAKMTRDTARALRQADGDGLDDAEWAEAGKRLTNGAH